MRQNWKESVKHVIAATICLVGIMGISVNASEGTIFHVENQEGKAGDVVDVPIEMNSGEEVGGFEITVYYDSEKLEFQGLKKGDLITEEEGLFDYNHKAENASVKIVYVVADTVKAEGVIANLTFKLKKDCKNGLPLGVGIGEIVDNSAESNKVSGKVSGVDEAFQAKVSPKSTVDVENTGEQEKPIAQEKSNDNEERPEEEKKEISKEKETKGDSEEKIDIRFIVGGFCAVIITLVIIGVAWLRRN